MSINLSSCLSSKLDQNNILSDRQSYLNDSLIGQVHDFSKDINQMENMITSMEEMSKDIRLQLLDLQTMPGVTNACSHLEQHTQHFESIVEDQIRSSLHRLSPVIMHRNLNSETKPYSTPEWRHQTSSKEFNSSFLGEKSLERTGYEFCTPPDFTGQAESRKQVQPTSEMCRRKLQLENDSEENVKFGNINSFTKEDHSNQNGVTGELDVSHFTACLDQGLKKPSPKEKSSDPLVQRHSQMQTNTATEPLENKIAIGTEPVSKSGEKSEETTVVADSDTNVNLKDLVSQAAKLLDNNGTDLGIDTDLMVDSMLSEIREAFNQNVEKVFKDVDTADLLSKESQETSDSKSPSAKKNFLNVPNIDNDDADVSVSEKKTPGEYEMCEVHNNNNVDNAYHDYYYYYGHPPPPFPPPPPFSVCVDTDCDPCTWEHPRTKQAWTERNEEELLRRNNRRRKKKKEEEEVEEEEEEEEGEGKDFCPYISGGVRPHKGSKLDHSQPKKLSGHDREKKCHQHQKSKGTKKGNNFDEYGDSRFLLSDQDNCTTTVKTPVPCCSKGLSKHKRCVQKNKSPIDKKSRGVHFSDTVRLIEDNDGDVIESEILMPQEKLDKEHRGVYAKYSSNGGHSDEKTRKKHGKKFSSSQNNVNTQKNEFDRLHQSVTASQERNTHDKSVMTAWDVPKTNPTGSIISAWTKECWNDPTSPRTRTENWKCNSRVEDEQNRIFKSFTIESISTDKMMPSVSAEKTLPLNQWTKGSQQYQDETYAKRTGKDHDEKDNSKKNGMSEYNIAGGCGPELWNNPQKGRIPGWQMFDDSQSNPNSPRNSSDSQMAFVCCILPQNICNSNNKNIINASENVYISNMMLNDLKGEDLKNPQKIGQPIEASEAKKVSYLVRELMEHLHANENILNKDYPQDKEMAAGIGSSPIGRKMSWVDAVKPGKNTSPRLSQSGSPILFCYLDPEFLPQAHQVKSLKKPSKESRKTTDISSSRDKISKKSSSLHKGCQTEVNNRMLNNRLNDNQAGMAWWISAPPRAKKKPSSRIQQIYANRLPPPVPLVTVKGVGKESRFKSPDRKVKTPLSPYNKKPKLGLNSSPTKKKPFVI